ncbi:lipoyl(octanoyl) transferase LipB [bacterium AH-315-M05]|nr:lipoyl(octanoyl) transferase LipB [bacterium AH-315-M05]
MQKVNFIDLGLIDYKECWDYQEQLFREIVDTKTANRQLPESEQKPTKNYLLFCEHPHVYTLGNSGAEDNLLIDNAQLNDKKASFYKINRGGDITYHGPGQLVGYPIFDLDNFFTDIHKYLRYLEEAIILTLAEYNITATRIKGATGVWIDPDPAHAGLKARKICAMGVRCSRWVTMHGFAFNVNANLSYFDNIVPCGIYDKSVTSLERESNKTVDIEEVKKKLKKHLAELFGMEFQPVCPPYRQAGDRQVQIK